MDNIVACSHPGKMGDALYALPTIRELSKKHNSKVDFYTSSYCSGLKSLFEWQSYIRYFKVLDDYKIKGTYCGIQPWDMPVPKSYEHIYQLGFKSTPNKNLPQYIADSAGINKISLKIEFPSLRTLNEPYIVISKRLGTIRHPHCVKLFNQIIKESKLPAVIVGGSNEYLGNGINQTGMSFLDTIAWIHNSTCFIGNMSSQLVLANYTKVPKIVVPLRKHFHKKHLIFTDKHKYLPNNVQLAELKKAISHYVSIF